MDPGLIETFPWDTITPFGLLLSFIALLGLGLMKGWIVVKVHYDRAVSEGDHWREAHRVSEEARHVSEQARVEVLKQLGVLTTAVERQADRDDLAVSLLESVRRAAREGSS